MTDSNIHHKDMDQLIGCLKALEPDAPVTCLVETKFGPVIWSTLSVTKVRGEMARFNGLIAGNWRAD